VHVLLYLLVKLILDFVGRNDVHVFVYLLCSIILEDFV
jgi:hypothetical protein